MRRYWFPKAYADLVARLRVPSGFLLVAAFAYLATPTVTSLLYGVPLSILGLWLRGWAAGHLAKNENLATGGPYAYLRNPLYLGTLLVAAGLVISSARISLAILFAVVFIGIYLPVIELEEQHLRAIFPGYEEYAHSVPILIPAGKPYNSTAKFQPRLYRRNQEYQALLGYLAGLAFLVWKSGIFTA